MEEEKYEQPDDKPVGLTLRSAVVGKGVEHSGCGCRSLIRLWGRIKLVAFYGARLGFIRVLSDRSLPGDGAGLAVGGIGRRHYHCESRRLLFGGSSYVVKFSERLRFCGDRFARFPVSSVLAVDTFKAAWDLTISEPSRRI